MSWEQHRYAVERAARLRRKAADEINEANQGVSLQGEAQGSDAEMLEEVGEFLRSLDGAQPGMEQGERFVADWNATIAHLSCFCSRYDLPKPDMIFHPSWQRYMSTIAGVTIGSPIIYAGVRVRFGRLESRDVLL